MSKKTFMATIIILAFLISLVEGMQVVEVAKADPYFIFQRISPIPGSAPPQITIFNPQDNITYNSNTLISFNVSRPLSPQGSCFISHIEYKLDNNKTLLYDYMINGGNNWTSFQQFSFSQNFNLSEGNHSLIVESEALFLPGSMTIFYLDSSSNVSFMIDTSPPSISNLSSMNKTYNSNIIPLNFNVNKTTSWLGYSLDNQNNITIAGNTTLTGLPDGSHSLVVYANDTVGNIGKSDTVFFTIDTSTPTPSLTHSPSPSIFATQQPSFLGTGLPVDYVYAIVTVLAIIVVAVVSLLVYFKKLRK
jgi:hypothetical protein